MSAPAYYDISNILATKAAYMILLGERANGKSYQVKLTVLTHAFETGRKFIYLRRWQSDLSAKSVESYFNDMDIKKITKKKFDCVTCYAGYIYFGITEDKGKITRAQEIGRYLDLNEQQRYKSQSFPDYDYIVFEEFISTGIYLTDEPRELASLISTVARHRKITILMVGNTISRICPYFEAFSLDGVLKQKPGTIDVYHWHVDEETTVDVAVEYCQSAGAKNVMFHGKTQKSVVGTEWDTYDYPGRPTDVETDLLYELILQHGKFKFMMQLYAVEDGSMFVFVYPCTSDRMTERVITDKFNISPLYSIDFNVPCKPVQLIKQLIDAKKVCFSDNLTGTEFYTIIQQMNIY